MHRLCSAADARLLDFYEVAYDGAFFHSRIHPQMSEWPDRAIIGNLGIKDDAMVFDRDAIAKARIGNARPLMNLASFTDDGFAFNVHVRMNHGVATYLRLVAYVSV